MRIITTGFHDNEAVAEFINEAIFEMEARIQVPYPDETIAVRRVSMDEIGGACGVHQDVSGTWTAISPVATDGICWDSIRDTIVHEIAHAWFRHENEAFWIDEGLATVYEKIIVEEIVGWPAEMNTYCQDYRNIQELENAADYESDCPYRLGEGIFWALRDHVGVLNFDAAIGEMAWMWQDDEAEEILTGIDLVRYVFVDLLGDQAAGEIIDKWYSGDPQGQ